jgi:hypothetical protein
LNEARKAKADSFYLIFLAGLGQYGAEETTAGAQERRALSIVTVKIKYQDF